MVLLIAGGLRWVPDGGQVGVMKNSGWFLNSFLIESRLNPLRGLPFGHLCCFDSWVA